MQQPLSTSTRPLQQMSPPPPAVQSYMVPSYDASPQPPPVQQYISQYPPAYVPHRQSQPPPNQGGYPHQAPSAQPPPQHFAQPSFPPHFAPPMRGMPSTAAPALAPQRSSVMPAARSSRRPSAFPAADDLFVPEALGPPPNLIATFVFLGGPLVLATMVVAVLALR
jgi:hypothetical protein